MSYIIGKACEGVCDTICVKVCPIDCIHGPISTSGSAAEVDNMSPEELKGLQLYIDPATCINCGACLPECPVDAIYDTEADAIEKGELDAVNKNYEFFGRKFGN